IGETWVYISTPDALANFTWSYSTATWLEHDRRYQIVAKTYDSVDNGSVIWSTVTFISDNYQSATPGPERPNSITQTPVDSVYFDQLTSISGTAKDNPYHGGIQAVQYAAKNTASAFWWGGADFNQPGETWLTASSWVYDPPNLKYDWNSDINVMNDAFANDTTYALYTKALDFTQYPLENREAVFSTNTIICDRANPVSITTMPANGARYGSIAKLNGTAWDLTAGVNSVDIRIKRNSDGNYWNTSSSIFDIAYATNAWFNVLSGDVLGNATTSWVYAVPGNPWTSGISYETQSRARDRVTILAAHYETAYTTVTFTYDLVAPTPVITDPAVLSYITAPLGPQTTVQGTIETDATLVEVRLKDLTQGATYWNEGTKAWQANPVVWNTANIYAPGFWRLLVSSGAWVSGRKYELYVKGTDSSIPTANVAYGLFRNFWYDVDKPTGTVL
ncbi:MAG: hypothetical protein AAB359_09570, partial [Elusimicrobiota bacterium]